MGHYSLIESVKADDGKTFDHLLADGCCIEELDLDGWTALCWAAAQGKLEFVKLLTSKNANVFHRTNDGRTPYQIAIAAGYVDVAKCLFDAEEKMGGDTERRSSQEWKNREFCKAFLRRELEAFPDWSIISCASITDTCAGANDDIVFVHHDFTVTLSIWHNEDVLVKDVSKEWIHFCQKVLKFRVPDDFDLM